MEERSPAEVVRTGHSTEIDYLQEIQESDMILLPDPDTAVIDPFRQHPTLNLNCFVRDPITGESYSRDPRVCSYGVAWASDPASVSGSRGSIHAR